MITLSVFILVIADLGYTFVASINDELLRNIEWLWTFIFSIGYILLTVSILWFSKIKEILEYRKYSENLQSRHSDSPSGNDSSSNKLTETFDNSNQILSAMTSLSEKAEKHMDILFARYFIQMKDIIKFINTLGEITKSKKLLNIRILLPSAKFKENDIPTNIYLNISIKYFDRNLSSNTVTSILDSELMYVMGSESENSNSRYFVQRVNSEPKKLVYTALFERMWLLEKAVDFG